MIKLFKKLRDEISAVAAIEFAILLPLLLVLLFGAFEISRYIMASRKADNIANDIGYLLSREGDINDANKDLSRENPNTVTEDAGKLRDIIQSVVPMMLYPFKNENYELEVRYLGLPTNNIVDSDGDGNDDNGINRRELRIMWAHCEKRGTKASGEFENECSGSSDDETAKVTDQDQASIETKEAENIGGKSYSTSTYFDIPDRERAKMVLPGQGFIITNFAYGYDQVLKNFKNIVGIDLDKKSLEKLSTYAVRSRWIDENADGEIQPSEFRNYMHICVLCNVFDSDSLTGGNGREECVKDIKNDPSSGCEFN